MIISNKTQQAIKWVIHYFALMLSCLAVLHTMIRLSNDIVFQVFFGLGAIFVELFAQYIWGLSFAYAGDFWRKLFLRIIYLIYIIVFASLSAIGVFMLQVDIEERNYSWIAYAKQTYEAHLEQINRQIDMKINQQSEEYKDRGRGSKYNSLEQEILALKEERIEIENKLKSVSESLTSGDKSIFKSIEEQLGVPANKLKLAMFGAFMAMIYLALILTPWEVSLEVSNKVLKVTSKSNNKVCKVPGEPSTKVLKDAKSEGVSNNIPNELTKRIAFVESLYDVENQNRLKRLQLVYRDIQSIGVTYRECIKYHEELNALGAIITTSGNTKAVWPLEQVLGYLKGDGVNRSQLFSI